MEDTDTVRRVCKTVQKIRLGGKKLLDAPGIKKQDPAVIKSAGIDKGPVEVQPFQDDQIIFPELIDFAVDVVADPRRQAKKDFILIVKVKCVHGVAAEGSYPLYQQIPVEHLLLGIYGYLRHATPLLLHAVIIY
jgi:hypothetical protein